MTPRDLIERYAETLPTDTTVCAVLFADEADYITAVGGKQVHLHGRTAIQDFIAKVPRQLTFTITSCEPAGDDYVADVRIEGANFAPVNDQYRFQIEHGQFKRFEVVQ